MRDTGIDVSTSREALHVADIFVVQIIIRNHDRLN